MKSPTEALIVLQDIEKTTNDVTPKTILHELSLTITAGEKVAILGPSGSGKTTLMNIIGLLDQASSGSYLLSGSPIPYDDDAKVSALRAEMMGFVFQSFHLLANLSVLENVLLPRRYVSRKLSRHEHEEAAFHLLERVNLADRAHSSPMVLSGGEKQRVAIARALINHPKVLLADEPTGALDSKTRDIVMNLFHEIHASHHITTIMVTHDREIAHYGNRIISLKDGHIEDDVRKPQ